MDLLILNKEVKKPSQKCPLANLIWTVLHWDTLPRWFKTVSAYHHTSTEECWKEGTASSSDAVEDDPPIFRYSGLQILKQACPYLWGCNYEMKKWLKTKPVWRRQNQTQNNKGGRLGYSGYNTIHLLQTTNVAHLSYVSTQRVTCWIRHLLITFYEEVTTYYYVPVILHSASPLLRNWVVELENVKA